MLAGLQLLLLTGPEIAWGKPQHKSLMLYPDPEQHLAPVRNTESQTLPGPIDSEPTA